MPPKRSRFSSDLPLILSNPRVVPRVVLGPLRGDFPNKSKHKISTLPPTASLFKKPDLSDLKLKVGDNSYYAHKLILCAGSEVFNRMLSGSEWSESSNQELVLQEDEECVKIFERFLYYFYAGSITISESNVIAIFILADKYDVKPLYEECVKVIVDGLKVFIIFKPSPRSLDSNTSNAYETGNRSSPQPASSSDVEISSFVCDSFDDSSDDLDTMNMTLLNEESKSSNKFRYEEKHLIGCETFPLNLVMKMLTYCANENISSAAIYNLQARLANHIMHENYAFWNDLDYELLIKLLNDKFFYCSEYFLYKAAKSWLSYKIDRKEYYPHVLCAIRYPNLQTNELYVIEKEDLIKSCPAALDFVNNAIRYKLFKDCVETIQEDWKGPQFEKRQVKDI